MKFTQMLVFLLIVCLVFVPPVMAEPAETDPSATPEITFHPYYGDVNFDLSINAADALTVLQHSVKLLSLQDDRLSAADIDDNGQVNASDALYILQASTGIEKPLYWPVQPLPTYLIRSVKSTNGIPASLFPVEEPYIPFDYPKDLDSLEDLVSTVQNDSRLGIKLGKLILPVKMDEMTASDVWVNLHSYGYTLHGNDRLGSLTLRVEVDRISPQHMAAGFVSHFCSPSDYPLLYWAKRGEQTLLMTNIGNQATAFGLIGGQYMMLRIDEPVTHLSAEGVAPLFDWMDNVTFAPADQMD